MHKKTNKTNKIPNSENKSCFVAELPKMKRELPLQNESQTTYPAMAVMCNEETVASFARTIGIYCYKATTQTKPSGK